MREFGHRLFPERHIFMDEIGFYLVRFTEQGTRQRVSKIEYEDVPEGLAIGSPAFSLDMAHAQALMDRLWDVGLRASQGKQSEGVVAAQGRHLEDMRALAFAKLSVERPNG